MHAATPLPDLLNRLARAGPEGLASCGSAPVREQLDLCRSWGFPIRQDGDRLCLPFDSDTLAPAWIEQETPCLSWDRLRVEGFLEIGSTNDEALVRARAGDPGDLLIYAECQTAGRGRKGRRWESPPRGGLYFTLLLRPAQPLKRWPLLTHAAAVALARALKELFETGLVTRPLAVDLKWPNDVLLGGKKSAGILLETAQSAPAPPAAALGVGVNVGPETVPEQLRDRATSVSAEGGCPVPRRRLLVRFLYFFQLAYDLFESGRHEEVLEQWKSHSSMWDGVPVWIVEDGRSRPGVTCGLSDLGALRVRMEDGKLETILAADVSVRRA